LGVNQLIGFGAGGALGPPAEVSHTDNSVFGLYGSAPARTVFTHSSQALGAANAGRKIVVAVGQSAMSASVATLTIGGVSASQVAEEIGGDSRVEIWQADVPTGTTGDVVVTWDAVSFRSGIGVYRVVNAAAAAYATATTSGSATSFSGTVTIPAGGIAIAVCFGSAGGTQTPFAWTNLTERYDEQVDAANSEQTGASDAFATLQTSRVVTCTPAIGGNGALVVASWGRN